MSLQIQDTLKIEIISQFFCHNCKKWNYAGEQNLCYIIECDENVENAIFAEKNQTVTQYACSRCNNKGEADKTASISKFPDKLIVLVKRFDNKLKKKSTYLNNFLMGSDKYRLKAIVSHRGKLMMSGHYKTFQFLDETMIEYDDKNVSTKPIQDKEAYILGFEKIA